MIEKELLMIPGPTPLPPRVVEVMTRPIINHRGPRFKEIFKEAIEDLKELLNCSGDVFLIPSSGTGAMELAVDNFTSKGDKVIVVANGIFGERFHQMNMARGRNSLSLNVPWGRAAKAEEIEKVLLANPDAKAIFIIHNETSATTINNIKELSSKIKEVSNCLIIVDAVSSIGVTEIDMDNWGIDVVVAASQKGLMSPPGIGIVAASQRAMEYALQKKSETYYFDVKGWKKNVDLDQTLTTFPVSIFLGLSEALKMIREEGYKNVYERHIAYRSLVRNSLKELNLKLLANDQDASPSLTGIYAPEGINADDIINAMRQRYRVEIASAQGNLKGKVFRISHMGYITSNDLLVTISALECVLKDLGYNEIELGRGTKKFLELRRKFEV